jgi:RimJ/RimL family protein N-acetyltransferase
MRAARRSAPGSSRSRPASRTTSTGRSSGTRASSTTARRIASWRSGTRGWCPSAWGAGANTEAKYLLLRHAFEAEGYLRVEFKTDATNARARAALAALPAEFEGVFRKHMLVRGGERRDSAWYAVIDDDWPEVKASLERRLAFTR